MENWKKEMEEHNAKWKNQFIPMEQCVKGRVYEINCRNLRLGVYDGNEGFIGIRQKFNSRYLFTEFHFDQGMPFGTVKGQIDTGVNIPDKIKISEDLGSVDRKSGRTVYFDGAVLEGGRGWVFQDTDEPDKDIWPMREFNKELFDFLDSFENELYYEDLL